jgi:hypothetical protein
MASMPPDGVAPGLSRLTVPPRAATRRRRPEALAVLNSLTQMAADLVEFAVLAERHRARTRERHGQVFDDCCRAACHDQHTVGEQHRLTDAVGHEQGGFGELLPKIEQQFVHFVAAYRVECAERLVHQQHGRVVDQRPTDRYALTHAARQLVRPLVLETVEPNLLQQIVGGIAVILDRTFQDSDREQHVVQRALPR